MQRDDWIKLGVAGLATSALGFAAATMAMGGSAKTAKEPNIYYKSQAAADEALKKFDKDNPDCQLWTNWQKMCSRAGEDGTTSCVTDLHMPARPSVPFCAGGVKRVFSVKDQIFDDLEKRSATRFCKDLKYGDKLLDCYGKKSERPFNGRRVALLRSPLCEVWSSGDRPVCAEGDSHPELPRCAGLGRKSYPKPLHCSKLDNKFVAHSKCEKVVRSEEGPEYPLPEKWRESPILPMGKLRAETFVHSIYCGEYKR
jgi:hypothetical protein